jgi:hypothetical protein
MIHFHRTSNGAKSVTKAPDCIDPHDLAAGKAAFALDTPDAKSVYEQIGVECGAPEASGIVWQPCLDLD